MSKATQKPRTKRTFKIWVRPTVDSELILYKSTSIFRSETAHHSRLVPATLTLDPPKKAGRSR